MPDGLDISARITADSSQLGAAMDSAAARTQRFAEEMKRVGNDLTRVDAAFVETGQRAQEMAIRMQAAGATAMTAATQTAEGLNKVSINAGESREAIVLLHEVITGRFSRIPGSLMVLAERFGSLGTIVGAIASPLGIAAVGATAAAAAIGYLGYQAIAAENEIQQTADTLTLLGRGTTTMVADLHAQRAALEDTYNLGTSAATALVTAFAKLPGVTLDEAQQLAGLAAQMAKVNDTDLAKTADEIAKKAQDGSKAFIDWAQKIGFELDPAIVKNIDTMERAGDASGALRSAIMAVAGIAEDSVGSWTRLTAAVEKYNETVALMGPEAATDLAIGQSLGLTPPAPTAPAHPPPPSYRPFGGNFGSGETLGNTGNDETAVAKRIQDDTVAAVKDENAARITTLRTEIASTKEMSKKIALIRQLHAEEVRQGKEGPQEGSAKADQQIAAAERAGARGDRGATSRPYQSFAEGERQKIEEARGDQAQISAIYDEWLAHAASVYGQDSAQYKRVLLEKTEAARRAQHQIFEEAQQNFSAERSIDESYLSAFKSHMAELVATHQISKAQEYGFDIEYTAQLRDQLDQQLQAIVNNDALAKTDRERAWDELLTTNASFDAKIVQDQAQAAQTTANNWKEAAKQLSDSFATALTEILDRSKTTVQAMSDLLNSLLKDTLKSTFQGVFSSLLGGGGSGGGGGGLNLGSLIFGSQGLGGALGLPSGGLLGMLGIGGGSAGLLGSLGAGGGFGLTAAESAGLGIPGAVAPSGFLGFLSSIFAAAPALAAASGGWVVPSFANGGILSMLHQNEMVLPANISTGLQGMIANGGGGGGNAISLNVMAWDGKSVMSAGPQILAALNKALRNGGSLYAGAYS